MLQLFERAVNKERAMTGKVSSKKSEPHPSSTESTEDESGLVTSSSRPVDMDQFCGDIEGDRASGASVDPRDDATSETMQPDTRVAPARRVSARTSALTRAMTLRQSSITKNLTMIIEKQLTVAEDSGTMSKLEIASLRQQMELAIKKQEHMTDQFGALVQRLEQEAHDKEVANRSLRHTLSLSQKKLKEGGLLEDKTGQMDCTQSHSNQKSRRQRATASRKKQETFSITEILCASKPDIDEMTCHFQEDDCPGMVPSAPPTPSSGGTNNLRVHDTFLASELELLEV